MFDCFDRDGRRLINIFVTMTKSFKQIRSMPPTHEIFIISVLAYQFGKQVVCIS